MSQTRLLIINFAGDVRDAYHRLAGGGPETYYAQRYSVEGYARMGEFVDQSCVLVCTTAERYDEILPNGVRVIGGGLSDLNDPAPLFGEIERIAPTHVALFTPDARIVRWLSKRPYRSIGCFTGSIPNRHRHSNPLRWLVTWARNAQLASYLNGSAFEWVGSYGLASCTLLAEAGVKRSKIVPWDLLLDETPGPYPPKELPDPAQGYSLCYVGAIQEGKGVGDLIEAVALLRRKGFPIRATIVGDDREGFARTRIENHGVQSAVTLAGLIPNAEVEPLMQQSDVVVVPSRPQYPEGFPLVIHHGLRARTPIVASDHPLFLLHLKHETSALLFKAGKAQALADSLQRLLTDAKLYAQLSAASHDTWRSMRLPVKCFDILEHWLRDTSSDRAWLSQHTFTYKQ